VEPITAPAVPEDTMTTVRIAHAEPRPGKLSTGGFSTRGYLVVLADDAGRRAVPIWMTGEPGGGDLSQLVGSAREIVTAGAPQELTARLLHAVDATVTSVDLDVTTADATELTPQDAVARIGLTGPAGARQVTAALGLGLAMAAATDAPVRLPDALMDRLAVPVPGDDLLTPFLDRVPRAAQARPGGGLPGWPLATLPGQRPRYEPRNMEFTDGLDRWDLDLTDQDYSAATDGPCAILSSAVPRPAGSAALVQAIFADDYRGATVIFRGEIRAASRTEQAGLRLEILTRWWRSRSAREDHGMTIHGGRDWTAHEITALIPADADMIRFGISLSGPGRVFLRHPEFRRAEPVDGAR
jgi:hypothetical protein